MNEPSPRDIAATLAKAVLEELLRSLEEQEAQPADPSYGELSEGSLVRLKVCWPGDDEGGNTWYVILVKDGMGWRRATGSAGVFKDPDDRAKKSQVNVLDTQIHHHGDAPIPTEEDLQSLRDALWGVDREAAAVSEPKHCCALCDLAEKISKVLS